MGFALPLTANLSPSAEGAPKTARIAAADFWQRPPISPGGVKDALRTTGG